jgi:hypothetical protein
MDESYFPDLVDRWPEFYNALSNFGPLHVQHPDASVVEVVACHSTGTDFFWSDSLQDLLYYIYDDLDEAVRATVVSWFENVQQFFQTFPYVLEEESLNDLKLVDIDVLVAKLLETLRPSLASAS